MKYPTCSVPLFVALCLALPLAPVSEAIKCRRMKTTAERCFNPPVELKVDIPSYTGQWFQIFTSGDASTVSNNTCVTANYTLTSLTPPSVDVLNCQFDPEVNPRPQCVRGVANRRPGAKYDSQLQVQFFKFAPPGMYNIAALLGDKNYGYQVAAVYSCRRDRQGKLVDGFYFIGRSPYAPWFMLHRLLKRLRCNGYKVNRREFELSYNTPKCEYMNPNGDNFDVNALSPRF